MVSVKCPKCGTEYEIDERKSHKSRCPACGYRRVTIEQNADEDVRKKFAEKKGEAAEECRKALEEYEQTGSVKRLHAVIENCANYRGVEGFGEMWRLFILSVAGESVRRGDRELQTYLKNHAKKYDAESDGEDGLYLSVLQSYSNVGANNDWDDLIRRTQGDEEKFTALSENIIGYIVRKRDKAFAMDIFHLLAAKGAEWADAGRIYLRTLLSSGEVAAQVFPRSAFNRRTKKFFQDVSAYCRKYLKGDSKITLEEMTVWKNYVDACKFQKRRNIGIAAAAAAVLLCAGTGMYFYLDAPAAGSIEFNVDRVIEATYGEPLDLSAYSVTYRKNSGREVEEPLAQSMLRGFDPELVGKQQTAYIEYEGESIGITVLVNPAVLEAPVLAQSGNYVTWDFVANAAGYSVYVNSTSAPVAQVEGLSYDLSANANFGSLTVTVRAEAPSEKYTNSALSAPLAVSKLQAPHGLSYAGGVLRWSAVEGAASYDVTVNGTPLTAEENFCQTDLAQGENEIVIVAKSASASVVDGIARETFDYSKLEAASQPSYSGGRIRWEAGAGATSFSLYVDGEYWRDVTRNYIDVEADGFASFFGEGEHAIGVICRSSLSGVEVSDMAEFSVDVGNRIFRDGDVLRWDSVGQGATYTVVLNGQQLAPLVSPYLAVGEAQWREGENTLSVTAELGTRTIVCETATVTKLSAPRVSVAGGTWVSDGGASARYRFDGGAWSASLPALAGLAAGEHTLEAMRAGDPASLQLDSDSALLTIRKLASPVISVEGGQLAGNITAEGCTLQLYYCREGGSSYTRISSLADIRTAGNYTVYAAFSATDALAAQYGCVLDSEPSNEVPVTKLPAPSVFYEEGAEFVTSDAEGARFFYMQDGEERELPGGQVAALPAGTFQIYARLYASAPGELTSENTPQDARVSVYNLDVTLSINKATTNQIYAVFDGCEGIASLSFTYEMRYYNAEGAQIGKRVSIVEVTVNNDADASLSTIATRLPYNTFDILFEEGYSFEDARELELVVYFSGEGGAVGRPLSASMAL